MTASPLSPFARLSPSVHLYTPPSAPLSSQDPAAILLCSWLNALPRHLTKYTTTYRTRYPRSQILVITSTYSDFGRDQSASLAPAITALLAHDGPMLVHSFSSGGAHQLLQLAAQYRRRAGKKLPVRALVLDSAPSSADLYTVVCGLVSSLRALPWWRRYVATALAWVRMYLLGKLLAAFGVRNPIERVRAGLNSGEGWSGERRVYVYGPGDEVVKEEDVESHASEAEMSGCTVRRERFVGTGHVAHVRADEERYWAVVGSAWTGAGWDGVATTATTPELGVEFQVT
ncbi:hypothetical protein FN846DRAFT_770516 [Sphaerosporella brunnea]|uniref:Indole-diterpene biosynthesis protein PaxU n=1 Tax=Sphaerosporella brunnea TaxID=1250544 RepID=A0A5J5FCE5_9PEZI|nr:hypothetical protein FN846DRAFT_770516 [Sphaerosporella brunnea]